MAKKQKRKAATSVTDILIIPSKKEALSSPKKTYNAYIKEVDKRKLEVKNLEEETAKIKQRLHLEIFSEMDNLQELRFQRLEIMDSFFSQELSQKYSEHLNKAFFDEVNLILAESDLYPMNKKTMEKVIEMHDKHSEKTYQQILDSRKQKAMERMKSSLKELGIEDYDMQDFDMANMHNILKALEEKRERNKNENKQQQEQEKIDEDEEFAAQINAKKEHENQRTKTIKGIYKRLVKDLHPDLEADIDEQIRKNGLMQRITRAYSENDFFELLKLNIEHQTQNKGDISKLADQEIEYYNQILKLQVKDLKVEIREIKRRFLYTYFGGKPQRTGLVIRSCKDKIKKEKEDYKEVTQVNFGSLQNWKQSINNKMQDDDSSVTIIDETNEKLNYKRKMDFLYGSAVRMTF